MSFDDARGLLIYWRHTWGVVFMPLLTDLGLSGIALSMAWVSVRYVEELRRVRSYSLALRNCRQYFADNVRTPLVAFRCLFIVSGFALGPFRVDRERDASLQAVASALARANRELREMREVIFTETHYLDVNDPAFGNMVGTVSAFANFRHAIPGPPAACHVKLTAPPESEQMARLISRLATIGPDCEVYGPLPTKASADFEREATTGMVSDMVVFHAARSDGAALNLFESLSALLPLRRSFEIPPGSPSNFVWLQFGPSVKWNSEGNGNRPH
jgi:hypothetical protein